MNLYHGSNTFFEEFDFDKSLSDFPQIHLTPHKQYAIDYALYKTENFGGTPYLYTVEVELYKDREYNEAMCNMIYGSYAILKIIKSEKL
jgi:hypothetical protein